MSDRSSPLPLREAALRVLMLDDPAAKAVATRALHAGVQADAASHPIDPAAQLTCDSSLPGRPQRPQLVEPRLVPSRSPSTPEGRAGLLHAIAHIEFNAINLALDAIWRFAGMPVDYYLDWLRVAAEEALHFSLLSEHLATLEHAYGDFDAHDGLWVMAQRTADDVLARMALVPRTLEVRGLDATPPLQAKLGRAGDTRAVEILDIILRDEIGHVAVGNHWYGWLCARQGLEPITTYRELARLHRAPIPRPPFNFAARRAAGFSEAELAALQEGVTDTKELSARNPFHRRGAENAEVAEEDIINSASSAPSASLR